MARKSIDIYATTNPALCSLVIWTFGKGFTEANKNGAEFPLLFLPVPIILSKSAIATFDGTNSRTGFLTWVARNPEITIDLAEKLERTSKYTRMALAFGIRHDLYTINEQGQLILRDKFKLTANNQRNISAEVRNALSLSQRLGSWLGQLNSTKNAFFALGITL